MLQSGGFFGKSVHWVTVQGHIPQNHLLTMNSDRLGRLFLYAYAFIYCNDLSCCKNITLINFKHVILPGVFYNVKTTLINWAVF